MHDALKRCGYLVLGALLFCVGFYTGQGSVDPVTVATGATNIDTPADVDADFSDFWKAWNIINERYYEVGSVSSQEKVWGAISGLLGSLDDPYSVFLPPQDTQFFNDMIAGSFGGVGMEIGKRNGVITVITPLKSTPAERAGIRAGDVVVKIDGELTTDFSVDEAVLRIRGDIGTKVELTIAREGESDFLDVPIVREEIAIPTLDTEIRDGVFILSLYNFDGQSASRVRGALREFAQSGTNKMVLDLRGNPGGILGAAVAIAGYFLPEGVVVVSERSEQGSEEHEYRSSGRTLVSPDADVVVLVDKGSASASEILAGALQEHKRAQLVGETTYGKGSVQELIPVTGDTSIKLTIGKWFTPDGRSISDGGLEPDVAVAQDSDAPEGVDTQLEKAIEILLGR